MEIIIHGCNGKMGKAVAKAAQNYDGCNVIAGVDKDISQDHQFPVFKSLNEINNRHGIIIDFSHPSALDSILNYVTKNHTPLVLCTTGYDDLQIQKIEESSKYAPIFYSRNMSLGINLLIELSKKAAKVLGKDFDIEIVEKHHNQKIDAPSGTAYMIAEEISQTLSDKPKYVFDRSKSHHSRCNNEIGIHSIRGGTIPGDHDVIFAGNQEVITLSHRAESRNVFAQGAVKAAIFIANKPAGLYSMKDMI